MNKSFTFVLVLVFLTASCLIVPLPAKVEAQSKTITVPDDFPTIKLAIDSATNGDSIYVRNGVYSENIVINKPLSIIGENPARTFINGTGSIVTIDAPNVVISGFTIGTPKMLQENSNKWGIRHFSAIGQYGVYVNNISNCNITNNRIVNTRYGIFLSSASNTTLISNLLVDNEIGINVLTSAHSFVSGNQIVRSTRAIILQRSSYNQILENTLINQTDGIVLHGTQDEDHGRSTYNLIRANNISNSQDYGIRLVNSLNNRVLENRIWNTPSKGIGLEWGASFNFVVSNLIYNFAPNSGYWGITIYDSNDNRISANYVINSPVVNRDSRFTGGIAAMNISSTQIIGNKIENNQDGINLSVLSSANNTLYANQIENTTNPYIIGIIGDGYQIYQDYSLNPDSMSIPQNDPIPQLSMMPNIEIPEVALPMETATTSFYSPSPAPTNLEFPTWTIYILRIIVGLCVGSLGYFNKHNHTRINNNDEIKQS